MTKHPFEVIVVDDHVPYRDMVAQVLEGSGKFHVTGLGGSAADAIRLAAELAPQFVLLDLNMPGNGLEAARAIASLSPNSVVIILTASQDPDHLAKAIRAGAKGYVVKGVSGRELLAIILLVCAGHAYVAPSLFKNIVPELALILSHGPRAGGQAAFPA